MLTLIAVLATAVAAVMLALAVRVAVFDPPTMQPVRQSVRVGDYDPARPTYDPPLDRQVIRLPGVWPIQH